MRPVPRRLLAATLAFALAAWLPGCAGPGRKHEARRVPDRGDIDPEQARELDKVTMPTYVVEPPDELEITIKPVSEDFNGGTVVVQQDGVIDLGLLGDVYVVGASLNEVEGRIAQRLNEMAIRSGKRPQPYRVSARLSNSQSKYYYVMGAVTTQGRFPIRGNETALDAILQAGLRSNSLPEKAYLVRPHPPGTPDQVLKIDWCGIRERGDTLTNYQLFPGDRIVVPGTRPPGLIATLLGQ
ncbi:MAG: polysaccharide biosynthesis/export family protein [Isosphaeraceae bacterium]